MNFETHAILGQEHMMSDPLPIAPSRRNDEIDALHAFAKEPALDRSSGWVPGDKFWTYSKIDLLVDELKKTRELLNEAEGAISFECRSEDDMLLAERIRTFLATPVVE